MSMIIDGTNGLTFNDSTTQTKAGLTGSTSQLAKAWVNFAGSNGTINSSYNVSSITYNGTGDYTINFTSALQDTTYVVVGTAQEISGTGLPTFSPFTTAFTTTTARVRTALGGTSLVNPNQVFAVVFR